METETIMTYLFGVGFLLFIVGFLAGKIAGADSPYERRQKNADEEKNTIAGREGKVEVKINEGEIYSGKSYIPIDQINNGDRFYTVIWKSLKPLLKKKRGIKYIDECEALKLADTLSRKV